METILVRAFYLDTRQHTPVLAPPAAYSSWYAMGSWIECSFKDPKRGGFLWHQTKITDPVRAERHWLAISIAMLWLVSVGGDDEAIAHSAYVEKPSNQTVSPSSSSFHRPPRTLSCFRRGFLSILVSLLWGQPLPIGRFHSFPWTASFSFSSA